MNKNTYDSKTNLLTIDAPITSFSKQELISLIEERGYPSYRAKQLFRWIYHTGISSYADISNIPAKLLLDLTEHFPLSPLSLCDERISSDGTHKYLFSLHDGELIESVAIPSSQGQWTVCCSTQVGCPMGCVFCATGKEGFIRNLLPGEIVNQVLFVRNRLNIRISNVVLMGQGEPFLNYDNVISGLSIINDPDALGIGARHITVSTCGIIPAITRFASEPQQYTLAVSLHAALQETRDLLMPHCRKYPLPALKKSLEDYLDKAHRRITFEYALIKGFNDNDDHLNALMQFCQGLLCHTNLIPLNDIPGSAFQPVSIKTLHSWEQRLGDSGINTTIRHSKGSDIAGACGQLKNTRF